VEHERALVRYLFSLGGTAAIIVEGGEAKLRCLVTPLDSSAGVYSLGFLAAQDPEYFGSYRPGFERLLQDLAQKHSIRRLVGPINGMTWFPYRLRVDEDSRSYPWEPLRHPELKSFLELHQFEKDASYHTICSSSFQRYLNDVQGLVEKVKTRGFQLLRLYPEQLTVEQLRELHALSLSAFSSNYLFTPISFEAFVSLYLTAKSDRPTFLHVALNPQQKMIAYLLSFLEGRELILKTVTTDPAYRKQGISHALIHALGQDLPEDMADTYISALVFKGLASEAYAKHGETVWEHHYILLSRSMQTKAS
jgi:ribosomal protein S18 acetylase RimI-like enzyme